jgi:cyclopropane-fatty-acyl-phospholipid synthase
MKQSVAEQSIPMIWYRPGRSLDRIARRLLLRRLENLQTGRLTIVDGGQTLAFGDDSAPPALRVTLTVADRRFYRSLVFGGSVGTGESYMAGFWDCDNLVGLTRLAILNESFLLQIDGGLALLAAPLRKLHHWQNKNTRSGSRANIWAHYDLGNALYALFLDKTMTYSCGVFENPAATLAEAAVAKYDRLCRKLDLKPSDHLLEIGTGWGGLAIHAASRYGCRVTTTTISQAQFDWAAQRIREKGLDGRIDLRLEDYRSLKGTYDKLISIEMIEAVGHHFLDTFFRQCGRLLKPAGLMALQAITITDQKYEAHKSDVDFIKRYIFPGSTLTSVTALCQAATKASDLRLFHLEDITSHYARTLSHWRERFFDNIDKVRALGYADRFIRMWDYYLCYCQGAFTERYIGDVQAIWVKPGFRPVQSKAVSSAGLNSQVVFPQGLDAPAVDPQIPVPAAGG